MKKIFFALAVLISAFCHVPSSMLAQVTQQNTDKDWSGTATGTNSYSVTISKVTSASPYNFQTIYVRFANTNTGPSTLKLNSYAAADITMNGAALVSGEIIAAATYTLKYNSTTGDWELDNFAAGTGSLSAWKVTGNAGTVDGTNFLGNTDNVPFTIRVNNQKAARISDNGSNQNTSWGYLAQSSGSLSGTSNNSFGYYGCRVTTTGNYNNSFGTQALVANTIGMNNCAFGQIVLGSNTSGSSNTAMGHLSGRSNVTGSRNVFLGDSAGYSSTGSNNLFLGYKAGNGWTGHSRGFIGNADTDSLVTFDFLNDYTNVWGRLGVGTATPSYKLQTRDDVNAASYVFCQNVSTGTGAAQIVSANNLGTGVSLFKLGENTTSLTGYGTARSGGLFLDDGSTAPLNIINANSGYPINFYAGQGANGTCVMSLYGSQVGIGVVGASIDASSKVHIKGSGATSATYWLKADNSASSPMLYGDNSGNIGIGDAVPETKLHVGDGTFTYSPNRIGVVNGSTYVLNEMKSIGTSFVQNIMHTGTAASFGQWTYFGPSYAGNFGGTSLPYAGKYVHGTGTSNDMVFDCQGEDLFFLTANYYAMSYNSFGLFITGLNDIHTGRNDAVFKVKSNLPRNNGNGLSSVMVKINDEGSIGSQNTGSDMFTIYHNPTTYDGVTYFERTSTASIFHINQNKAINGANLFRITDNSAVVLNVDSNSRVTHIQWAMDSSTTAGDAVTLNTLTGFFTKDATGSTFTLTNSKITNKSRIMLQMEGGITVTGNAVSPTTIATGSAVITFYTVGVGAGAPASDQRVAFQIIN